MSIQGSQRWEMGGSGVRLAASQVIERLPPAEVFRVVATEHFQNHPPSGIWR